MHDPDRIEREVISAVRDFVGSLRLKSRIVADLSSVIDATSQVPLSKFDYWEGLIRSTYFSALKPSTPTVWKRWFEPAQLVTWLDVVSWDGFRREKVLRSISGPAPNSFFLALAFRRLNDWVPQVREAAREKLPLIVKASDPVVVVDALCATLSNWNSWGRIQVTEKSVLLDIVSDQSLGHAFKSKIIASTSGPVSALLAQVGRTPALDADLRKIAADAVQPAVRAKAYRSLFESRIVWLEGREWEWTDIRYCQGRYQAIVGERKLPTSAPFLELLQESANDRSSIVRRVAAEFLIRELDGLGDDALQFARHFAADESYAVSERGKFAMGKLEEAQM